MQMSKKKEDGCKELSFYKFMMETFWKKLNQFEETGSIGKLFNWLGNPDKLKQFSKFKVDHVFRDYTFAIP